MRAWRGRRAIVALLASSSVALVAAASASAASPIGLPRTYDSIPVDTPNPIGGGSFGWGLASGDLLGNGYADLLVAQAQTGPGQVFAYDGKTGAQLHTIYGYPYVINPPESNVDATATAPPSSPTLAFVYVETMPSVGSCFQQPGLPTPQPGVMCPNPTVGPPDGVPAIVVGARNQQVSATDDASNNDTLGPTSTSPHIGRTYILDGLTGAVIQRIDMPAADRTLEANLALANQGKTASAVPQFGRVSSSLQGMPPCAGSNADNNAVGVGPCPPVSVVPRAVQIGDVTGDGSPDIITTARTFIEQVGPSTATAGNAAGTAAPGSQCANVPGLPLGAKNSTCSGGRAYVYDTAGIVGSNPQHIIDTPLYTIKNPDAQTQPQGSTEFGGNVYRIGDAVGGTPVTTPVTQPTGTIPDGFPDFVITNRNADYPLKNPDPTMPDVGVGYLYSGACTLPNCTTGPGGATEAPTATLPDPSPQPKAQFSSSFNGGRPVGYLNGSSIPDILLPSALQSTSATADGAAFLFNGDLNAGGGGEGSWHFGTLLDPSPHIGGNFGGSFTGVGNLTDTPGALDDDVAVGSDSPFDPNTPLTNGNINNFYIMNPASNTLLQTIPDPDQSPGSGFGVGLVPMGDLTGNGFMSYAASSYLWNGTVAGQGRAYILKADNSASPLTGPTAPSNPVPLVHKPPAPVAYKHGKCANTIIARAAGAKVIAPKAPKSVGFKIFGLGRNESIVGGAGDDCIKGTVGNDHLYAGTGNDTILGGRGNQLIFGGPGKDRLYGGRGNNQIYAGGGNTLLDGGPVSNLLVGGSGKDQIFAGPGHDVILAGRGGAYIDGGKGFTVIDAINGGKRDTINCGTTRTVALVEHVDHLINCAHVVYSIEPTRHVSKFVHHALKRLINGLHIARGPHPPRPK
jgi:Ca2+-binding RTX toxin-like protein